MTKSMKLILSMIFVIFSFFVLLDVLGGPELILLPERGYEEYPKTAVSAPQKEFTAEETIRSEGEPSFGRKVIKRGHAEIASSDLRKDLNRVKSEAERLGAFIVSEEVSGGDYREASITFAVPEGKYDDFIGYLRKNYDIISYSLSRQDVTEEYVDLEAQLKSAREELKAVESLLSRAKDVDEILKIREKSREIRLEVARLEQRLQQIEQEVSYSYVTVNFRSRALIRGERNWWSNTLRDAVLVFQRSLRRTILLLVALIPVALSISVIYLLVSAIRRVLHR